MPIYLRSLVSHKTIIVSYTVRFNLINKSDPYICLDIFNVYRLLFTLFIDLGSQKIYLNFTRAWASLSYFACLSPSQKMKSFSLTSHSYIIKKEGKKSGGVHTSVYEITAKECWCTYVQLVLYNSAERRCTHT